MAEEGTKCNQNPKYRKEQQKLPSEHRCTSKQRYETYPFVPMTSSEIMTNLISSDQIYASKASSSGSEVCTKTFCINKDFYKAVRDHILDSTQEIAGIPAVDFRTGEIFKGTKIDGKEATVSIPALGMFSWHIHPHTYSKEDSISYATPSDTDVVSLFRDLVTGSLAHFIFGIDGSYVITIEPAYLKRYLEDDSLLKKNVQYLIKHVTKHWDKSDRQSQKYIDSLPVDPTKVKDKKLSEEWNERIYKKFLTFENELGEKLTSCMNKVGMMITYFPYNEDKLPCVTVPYQCQLEQYQNHPIMIDRRKTQINKDVEAFFKKRNQKKKK
jgi:hypothetical protein